MPFLYRNANKRGVVLDLQSDGGRSRLSDLCEQSDILIENLDPDTRQELDLTPSSVRARHPHLDHVAMADFGLSGPRAGWRAEQLPAFAASGALHVSGFPDPKTGSNHRWPTRSASIATDDPRGDLREDRRRWMEMYLRGREYDSWPVELLYA